MNAELYSWCMGNVGRPALTRRGPAPHSILITAVSSLAGVCTDILSQAVLWYDLIPKLSFLLHPPVGLVNYPAIPGLFVSGAG